MKIARAFALAVLCLAPLLAAKGSAEDWRTRAHLTGDWGGARSSLAALGIAPYARYTGGFWANLHGGLDTGIRYAGFASWGADVDLGDLAGWSGGRFHIGWHAYHGGQPSADLVGAFPSTAVSGWEAADSVRFYEIYLAQQWLDGRLQLKLGQIAADDDFFVALYAQHLHNATFGFLGFGRDEMAGPFYPLAAPGAFVAVRPTEHWLLRLGAYTAKPGEDVRGNIGFDWSFHRGAFLIGEITAVRSPFGLPGRYSLGAAGVTARVSDFETGAERHGAWGLYAVVEQALVLAADGTPRLGAFLHGQLGPQEDRASLHGSVDGGLQLTGPLPGRDDDAVSLGAAYLQLSDPLVTALRAAGDPTPPYQVTLELTYVARLTGWLSLHPSLQYFVNPTSGRRDAVVLGMTAVVEL